MGAPTSASCPRSEFEEGTYELVFHAGAYLDAAGVPAETPRFLDAIPLRFGMSQASHYHVPLLLSSVRLLDLPRQLGAPLASVHAVLQRRRHRARS